MNKPLVSVIVLNYRSPQTTVKCVHDLQEQSVSGQMEILVVDNHSEDDSIGVLRNRCSEFENVRIIETSRNDGFATGYNAGTFHAQGEFVLINNPSKSLQKDGVSLLMKKMQSDPSLGIIAPKLIHPDGTRRHSNREFPRFADILARRSFLGKVFPGLLKRYLMLDVDFDKEQEVDWVIGGCFMIRRDVFEELGGFDERFFLFFEDTDLCRRCREYGKKVVYFPSVVAVDKKHRLSGEHFKDLLLKKTGRIHIISALKYFWKWRKGTI